MKTLMRLLALLPLSAAVLAGCSGRGSGSSATAPQKMAVEAAAVSVGTLRQTIAVVGTLEPKWQAEVKAEYSGVVAEVLVPEWTRVKKGDVLLRFDAREAEAVAASARASFLQAEVAAARATRERERTEKLKEAGLATQQQVDEARTAADAAQATAGVARAQKDVAETRLAKTVLRAPLDGVVASRSVNPGDFVQNMGSDNTMFRIVDNRLLDLAVAVPSSRLSDVRVGQPLTFATDAVPGRTFEGRVRFVNPAADVASRTVKVFVAVPNGDGALRSGLFVKGEIVTGERPDVLTAPRTAILSWDLAQKQAVLYALEGETARKRTVTTGATSGDQVEIVSGLAKGDRVVTRGGFNLRDGDPVEVVRPEASPASATKGS
ncbi:MAG TPA: efflux RND transporter periplasmic adaptor subunit [Thermoanaerobaculia bacterium]|nr:efflux RND transporter periplasmic adaptor subunit [Thermoanaerobaculia bacterium]